MRRYLLDTNICIFYMKGKFHLNEKIDDKMKRYCFISEITIAELLYGATCSNRKDKMLRSQGLLIDDFDLLIGASAVANDLILVTENVKHLERIPHLKIENWIDRAKI